MKRLLTYMLFVCLFILFLVGFATPNTALTQDLGRHLLLGEMILKDYRVPQTNLFSYTYPDFPFTNHHYLSEVLFFLTANAFGIDSLLILTICCMFLACLIVFLQAKKHAHILPLIFVSFLSLRILFERVDVRPEAFSFLLTSLFVTILFSFRQRSSKWILSLIPLSFIWVQLHIYFFVGILLIFLFLIDGLITYRKHITTFSNKLLLVTFLASCVITIFNPHGLSGALYPTRVFENYGYTIEENQTTFLLQSLGFHKPALPYFQFSVLLLFLSLFLAWKKSRPIDWLLALTFSFAGTMAVRNFPLFALVCFIPFTQSLSHLQDIITSGFFSTYSKQKKHSVFILLCIVLLIFLTWQIFTVSHLRGIGFDTKDPYKNGLTFFKEQNIKGPLFNNFDIGSYLIYSLYPKEQVFVDGRPEAYPQEFLRSVYIPMQENPQFFAEKSEQYNINSIIFSHSDQTPWAESFLQTILADTAWVPVYLDDSLIIFVKNILANQLLIKKYGMDTDTLTFKANSNNFQSLLKQARFANLIQNTRLEKQVYQNILNADPTFCPALQNLAIILSNESDPTASLFVRRYQVQCL